MAVAAVTLVATIYLQLLSAFAFGTYYLAQPGAGRVHEQLPMVTASLGVGLAGAAFILASLRGRILSPWLLTAFVIPALALANHAGLTR